MSLHHSCLPLCSCAEAASLVSDGASFVSVSIQPTVGKSRQAGSRSTPSEAPHPKATASLTHSKAPAVQPAQAAGSAPLPGCVQDNYLGPVDSQPSNLPEMDTHIDDVLEHTHFDVPALIAALQQQPHAPASGCEEGVSSREAVAALQGSTAGQQLQRQASMAPPPAGSRASSSSAHGIHTSLHRHSQPGSQAQVPDWHLPAGRPSLPATRLSEEDKAKLLAEFEGVWKVGRGVSGSAGSSTLTLPCLKHNVHVSHLLTQLSCLDCCTSQHHAGHTEAACLGRVGRAVRSGTTGLGSWGRP
jgi:hypothetical protein